MVIFWRLTLFIVLIFLIGQKEPLAQQNVSQLGLKEALATMPKSQRNSLARQYGIDISEIEASGGASRDEVLGRAVLPLKQRSGDEGKILSEDQSGNRYALEKLRDDLPRFGAHIFDATDVSFVPVDGISVPSNYVLGVGDSIRLLILGSNSSKDEIEVGRDGDIDIPDIGSVNVLGLTFDQASKRIKDRVRASLITSDVKVSMGRLKRMNIFISGEVDVPGSYAVSSFTTVLQALYLCGGISELGSYRNVSIKRAGKTVGVFDLYSLLLKGDNKGDIRLQNGDVVFVPLKLVEVSAVKGFRRSARFEIKKEESLRDFIKMAGGFEPGSDQTSLILNRIDYELGSRKVFNLDLDSASVNRYVLSDGDRLEVGILNEDVRNSIELIGDFVNEGYIGWEPEMRFSTVLGNINKTLKPSADLDVGLILRRDSTDRIESVIPVDIQKALVSTQNDLNPYLKPSDSIIVLPRVDEAVLERSLQLEDQLNLIGRIPEPVKEKWLRLAGEIYEENDFEETSITGESSESRTSQHAIRGVRANVNNERYLTDRNSFRLYLENKKHEINSRRNILDDILVELKNQNSDGEQALIVEVYGAVRDPGQYPLLNSTDLSLLVRLAGGWKEGANIRTAEISKLKVTDKGRVQNSIVKLKLPQEETGEVVSLDRGDIVRFSYLSNWQKPGMVVISGEVKDPGTYRITQGDTLADLMARAGGVKRSGYLEGLIYYSEKARKNQIQEFERLLQISNKGKHTKPQEVESALSQRPQVEKKLIEFDESILLNIKGRVAVDPLSAVKGDFGKDVYLSDGDRIHVPIITNKITVVGEVYRSGDFVFSENKSVKDYLGLAGGATEIANHRAVFFVNPNGETHKAKRSLRVKYLEFGEKDDTLKPGAVIVVPPKYYHEDSFDDLAIITQIAYQGVSSLALLFAID